MNKDDVVGLVAENSRLKNECSNDDCEVCDALVSSSDALTTLSARVETLETALENLIAHCHEQERILTEDLHHTDFCGESIVLLGARQALAGDTNHG